MHIAARRMRGNALGATAFAQLFRPQRPRRRAFTHARRSSRTTVKIAAASRAEIFDTDGPLCEYLRIAASAAPAQQSEDRPRPAALSVGFAVPTSNPRSSGVESATTTSPPMLGEQNLQAPCFPKRFFFFGPTLATSGDSACAFIWGRAVGHACWSQHRLAQSAPAAHCDQPDAAKFHIDLVWHSHSWLCMLANCRNPPSTVKSACALSSTDLCRRFVLIRKIAIR